MNVISEQLGKIIKCYDKIIFRHLETANYIGADEKVDLQPPPEDKLSKALQKQDNQQIKHPNKPEVSAQKQITESLFQIDLIQSEGEQLQDEDEEKLRMEIKDGDHIKLLHITTSIQHKQKYYVTSTNQNEFKSENYNKENSSYTFYQVFLQTEKQNEKDSCNVWIVKLIDLKGKQKVWRSGTKFYLQNQKYPEYNLHSGTQFSKPAKRIKQFSSKLKRIYEVALKRPEENQAYEGCDIWIVQKHQCYFYTQDNEKIDEQKQILAQISDIENELEQKQNKRVKKNIKSDNLLAQKSKMNFLRLLKKNEEIRIKNCIYQYEDFFKREEEEKIRQSNKYKLNIQQQTSNNKKITEENFWKKFTLCQNQQQFDNINNDSDQEEDEENGQEQEENNNNKKKLENIPIEINIEQNPKQNQDQQEEEKQKKD